MKQLLFISAFSFLSSSVFANAPASVLKAVSQKVEMNWVSEGPDNSTVVEAKGVEDSSIDRFTITARSDYSPQDIRTYVFYGVNIDPSSRGNRFLLRLQDGHDQCVGYIYKDSNWGAVTSPDTIDGEVEITPFLKCLSPAGQVTFSAGSEGYPQTCILKSSGK